MSCTNNINDDNNDNPNMFLRKVTKYLIMATVVALVSKWISTQKLNNNEISIISLTTTASFIMLDLYSPTIQIKNNNH